MVQVVNAVGGGELGVELQLDKLLADSSFEYSYESGDSMAYVTISGDLPTVTLFQSGKYSIAGGNSVSQLFEVDGMFRDKVSEITDFSLESTPEFEIRYLVGIGELGNEVDLSIIFKELPSDKVEYEPEQFPGLFYRPSKETTITVFSTGKVSVNGPRSEEALQKEFTRLKDKLDNIQR
ncbi:TBP family protein [Halopelagius longus]|uniref:hypothetical protein n=1 Tax=Halopelagius longus TaxID=1236180 RepID=UPI001587D68C|nr:hypothetical protein [Halopelagius longus]